MKKTSELFTTRNANFARLAQKINHLQTMNQYLEPILSSTLKKHCQVANVHQGQLVIMTTHALLTELRFLSPDILKHMQKLYPNIQTVKYITDPNRTYPLDENKKLSLSLRASEAILACAKSLDDAGLKEALRKLSSLES